MISHLDKSMFHRNKNTRRQFKAGKNLEQTKIGQRSVLLYAIIDDNRLIHHIYKTQFAPNIISADQKLR